MTTRRKYIYAALYIITAVITPDGGPIADIALFVPMAILLEVAVYFGKRIERKQGPMGLKREARKLVYLKCKFCGALLDPKAEFLSQLREITNLDVFPLETGNAAFIIDNSISPWLTVAS